MPKVLVCAADRIEPDGVLRVEMADRPALAIYNVGGSFFATDDACTHGEASLAEGVVVDGQIVCPFHGGTFDIKTGEPTGAPCMIPLRTYAVSMDGDHLYVELE